MMNILPMLGLFMHCDPSEGKDAYSHPTSFTGDLSSNLTLISYLMLPKSCPVPLAYPLTVYKCALLAPKKLKTFYISLYMPDFGKSCLLGSRLDVGATRVQAIVVVQT